MLKYTTIHPSLCVLPNTSSTTSAPPSFPSVKYLLKEVNKYFVRCGYERRRVWSSLAIVLTGRVRVVLSVSIYTYYTHWKIFLTIKPTRRTNYSNLFLKWNSICFGQFLYPSSGVFHCTHSNGVCHTGLQTGSGWNWSSVLILLASCQQTCVTYTIAVCTGKNSW